MTTDPQPMGTRRCWRTPGAGAIGRLQLCEEALCALAGNQVRVRVVAAGLNFADIFALTGLYSATPEGAFVPGLEFSGVIESVGSAVQGYRPGDAVMGVTRFGGYATVIDSPPAYLRRLPGGWDHAQGAAYLAQTLTAWYALNELGQLRAGERVLIHSAAGGVGLQAMKLARALGALPVGTVGDPAKAGFLATQGFTDVLVRERDFGRQLRRQRLAFDLVLDAIGGQVQRASFAALRPAGRLVVFGAAEFTPGSNRPHYLRAAWRYLRRPRYDVMQMISDNRAVLGFNLIWLWQQAERMHEMLDQLDRIPLTPPHVGRRFRFDDAPSAIEYLRSGRSVGKLVLTT